MKFDNDNIINEDDEKMRISHKKIPTDFCFDIVVFGFSHVVIAW